MRWGIDSYILDWQGKYATQYITLPKTFSTMSVKEKVSIVAATLNHNKKVLQKYLYAIKSMPLNRRMYRIPTICFPLYFNRGYSWLYKDIDYQKTFDDIGNFARKHKIRISIHSDMNVYAGISTDYNYFALNRMGILFKELGYKNPYDNGSCFCVHSTFSHYKAHEVNQQLKDNVDKQNLAFMAVENTHCKNSLYENMEIDCCAKIVDLHHHLVANQKYLSPKSKLWHIVRNSWQGETPKIHLSTPRLSVTNTDGDCLVNGKRHCVPLLPNEFYGYDCAPHSDFIWGKKYLNWAREFDADVMIEAGWCATATKMAANNLTSLDQLEAKVKKSQD